MYFLILIAKIAQHFVINIKIIKYFTFYFVLRLRNPLCILHVKHIFSGPAVLQAVNSYMGLVSSMMVSLAMECCFGINFGFVSFLAWFLHSGGHMVVAYSDLIWYFCSY